MIKKYLIIMIVLVLILLISSCSTKKNGNSYTLEDRLPSNEMQVNIETYRL